MKKAKILYIVSPTGKYAGIERVVDEVANELALRYGSKFDISVLHMSDYGEYVIGPRAYNYLRGSVRGRFHGLSVLRRTIKQGKYDLVIVPQIEPTVIVWISGLRLSSRLVVHLHGNTRYENTHWKANIIFRLFRLLVLNRLNYVFGTSKKQLAAFERDFPSRIPNYWTPNPVRDFRLIEREERRENDRVVFINVGRFSFQKGQDLVLEAFAEVVRLRPKAILVLVGYGDKQGELMSQARQLGIFESVRFEYNPQDPVVALAAADIYVSLSRWEGWSLAICEALRVGLPIVSSDCDFGPSDILIDRRLGRLVENGNKKQAVEAMLYYHDNITQERAFAAFRTDYIARFDVKAVVVEHASAIVKAIGS